MVFALLEGTYYFFFSTMLAVISVTCGRDAGYGFAGRIGIAMEGSFLAETENHRFST